MEDTYWVGPFGVLVSKEDNTIVIAADGWNIMTQDGSIEYIDDTKVDMTEEAYKQKYAHLGDDGKYYYGYKKIEGYWRGPFGVLVPNSKKKVDSRDGVNEYYRDGGETEMCNSHRKSLNRDEYREKYATLGDDSEYYYKY